MPSGPARGSDGAHRGLTPCAGARRDENGLVEEGGANNHCALARKRLHECQPYRTSLAGSLWLGAWGCPTTHRCRRILHA